MMALNMKMSMLAAALGLAGCAGAGHQAAVTPKPQSGPSEFPVAVGGLPPQQDLAPGSCGLFLWRKGTTSELVFMADSRAPIAHMMLDGALATLERTSTEGEIAPGRLLRQSFRSGERSIDLGFTAEPRPGLVDGAVVKSGSLRIAGEDGWDMVLPVAGLIACKPR